ncbi:MAG: glycosyltransferase family 4 protein [Candidatus Cloacimonetes bacterium]|nr:glycosyltransferase family 4 protein [Candidatus Cloacimonadota bacterium]
MNVWFIIMQFPNPREAFAGSDIKAFIRAGLKVQVHSLRFKHKQNKSLIFDRELENFEISHNSFHQIIIGLICGVFYPRTFLSLLWFIIYNHSYNLNHLVKSMILLPRVISLFTNIKKNKPDVIHLYWSHYPSLLGLLVKRYLPNIVLTMSFCAYDLNMRFKGGILLSKEADAVVAIAEVDIPIILDFGVKREKLKVIYRGVDPRYFNNNNIDKIENRIITAGALTKKKRIIDIIKVFEEVQKEIKNLSLVVLGDGDQREKLENYVLINGITNVSFKGHVSHEQVFEEMLKSEVFLFLSQHKEKIPNVVKEAMICNCYCIVSETEGISELIYNNISGSIISIGDNRSAIEELKKVIENIEYRKNAIKLADSRVKEKFNSDKSAKNYIKIWEQIIKEKGKS